MLLISLWKDLIWLEVVYAADSDSHMGIPLPHPEESGWAGQHWNDSLKTSWPLRRKKCRVAEMPQNVNPLTRTLKCVCREDKLRRCPRSQTRSVSFSRIQRIRFLFNCVASREATNSSRGFHSIQSSPLRPPGLYYILIHSQRKGKIPLTGNFHLSPTTTTTMMPWSHGRFISQQKT